MATLLVFAGPNGSGKSTITSGMKICGEYVNADIIKNSLNCSDLEAAQIAEATREKFLSDNIDFTFETVLSTERNIDLMRRAKDKGYTVLCIYVLTADPKINVQRVRNRVLLGGHDVPEDKIVSRYSRALGLLPKLFSICNELYVFDNSFDRNCGNSSLIIKCINGSISVYPNELWTEKKLNNLIANK